MPARVPKMTLWGCSSFQTHQLGMDTAPTPPLSCLSDPMGPPEVSQRALTPYHGCPQAARGPAGLTWWVCRTVRMMKSLAFLVTERRSEGGCDLTAADLNMCI